MDPINQTPENDEFASNMELDGTEDADEAPPPSFPPATPAEVDGGLGQFRRIPVPPHRLTPLRNNWMQIYTPIVQHLKLQIRMNTRLRCVELKNSIHTVESGALQKASDFVRAFSLGFDVEDCIALLRMDDLYVDSFEMKDVKTLQGEHLSRAIGRVSGRHGRTKYTIENATKTRIVLADSHIHILGAFQNINVARDAVVKLILGSEPNKVFTMLQAVSTRMKERF
eukprot:gnl/Spiro4/5042_TR2515_c0_g1_i1.p1 gnl/Spiro4/5042_TR2515_c0_g1~~gnl/Spiro4/5042_TR2515_c0_g1_i1.p1  ORF type:complete len:247 (+),score=64.96 gnl/Spiro4/5042_TR2515_c0_g1_i1:64-741(+)